MFKEVNATVTEDLLLQAANMQMKIIAAQVTNVVWDNNSCSFKGSIEAINEIKAKLESLFEENTPTPNVSATSDGSIVGQGQSGAQGASGGVSAREITQVRDESTEHGVERGSRSNYMATRQGSMTHVSSGNDGIGSAQHASTRQGDGTNVDEPVHQYSQQRQDGQRYGDGPVSPQPGLGSGSGQWNDLSSGDTPHTQVTGTTMNTGQTLGEPGGSQSSSRSSGTTTSSMERQNIGGDEDVRQKTTEYQRQTSLDMQDRRHQQQPRDELNQPNQQQQDGQHRPHGDAPVTSQPGQGLGSGQWNDRSSTDSRQATGTNMNTGQTTGEPSGSQSSSATRSPGTSGQASSSREYLSGAPGDGVARQ